MYSVISLAGPAILRKHRSHPLRHPSLICTPEHRETSLGRKYLSIGFMSPPEVGARTARQVGAFYSRHPMEPGCLANL